MKRFVFFFLFCAFSAGADTIVSGGKTTDQAVYDPANWWETPAGFSGTGQGNPLHTLKAYHTEGLVVKARLSLAKVEGTAAGIGIGNFLFGFDGGRDHKLFLEDSATQAFRMPNTENLIRSGEEFAAEIRCANGRAVCFLNGKKIGEVACGSGPETVYLRPWRSLMQVKEFSVTGKSVVAVRSGCPLIGKIFDSGKNAAFQLPPPIPFRGPCKGILTAVNVKSEGIAFDAEISPNGSVVIPAGVLQQACRKYPGQYRTQAMELELKQKKLAYRCRFTVQDASRKSDFAKGEVRPTMAGNRFFVNGTSVGLPTGLLAALRGSVNVKGAERFGKAGIHGKLVHLEPWKCFRSGKFDAALFAEKFQESAAKLIAADPDSTLMIQFELYMPPAWCDAHEQELIVLDNGKKTLANPPLQKRQPSYASPLWRKEAGNMVRDAVLALKNSPIADRIWYFKLLYGNCGEWNHWGYHEQAFVDLSLPMNRAFGAWLKKRYQNVEKLRAEWKDTSVSFDGTDLVPDRKARLAGGEIFRGPSGPARRSADYYAFFQEYAAGTIAHFARIAKAASGSRLVVGAYYGYFFGHYGLNYHFQDSGNYGVNFLLNEKSIDFIGGPDMYSSRRSISPLNGIVGSLEKAGKLWESEDDYRTHLALGPRHRELGATADVAETCAMLQRNFSAAISNRTNFYHFDFVKDWYQDDTVMATISRLHKLNAIMENVPPQGVPRLAVVFSENSVAELGSRPNRGILNSGRFAAMEFPLIGVPYDRYLLEAIHKIDFKCYQTVIFYNTYQINDARRKIIQERVAKRGRTLIFVYAPGMLNSHGALSGGLAKRLTGMELRAEPEKKYAPLKYKGTAPAKGTLDCRISIVEPGVEVLARHADRSVAAAAKKFPEYRSVVVCDIAPGSIFWRSLLADVKPGPQTSGIGSLDQTCFAWPLIGVSRFGKPVSKKIWFGKKAEVVADLWTGKTLGTDVPWLELQFTQPVQTYLLYAGSKDGFQKFFSSWSEK